MVLTQHKFTKEILLIKGVKDSKHVVTPLPINTKLSIDDSILIENRTLYRSFVGKLNCLTNTRPDFTFTVQSLSQFMQKPKTSHWKALLQTLCNGPV